jgi:hypothetical protein
MSDTRIATLVEQAVGKRFDQWAAGHPSLAAVIDRVVLVEQAAQSLRATDTYRQAVDAYRQARGKQQLIEELTTLAGAVLETILR